MLQARHGSPTPEKLKPGDIFFMLDAGKDRRRQFLKNLPALKGATDDKTRTINRQIILHCSEDSFKKRRKVLRGAIKLAQGLTFATSAATKIRPRTYDHYPSSNMADVLGPIELDLVTELPSLSKEDAIKWWGKHLVPAGGHVEDEESQPEGDEEDGAEGELQDNDLRPISMHALPDTLPLDIFVAFNIKHVIDFSPHSATLVVKLLELGISYWGLCASEFMKETLETKIHDGLVAALKNPQSGLFDNRLALAGGASPTTPAPALEVASVPNPKAGVDPPTPALPKTAKPTKPTKTNKVPAKRINGKAGRKQSSAAASDGGKGDDDNAEETSDLNVLLAKARAALHSGGGADAEDDDGNEAEDNA